MKLSFKKEPEYLMVHVAGQWIDVDLKIILKAIRDKADEHNYTKICNYSAKLNSYENFNKWV